MPNAEKDVPPSYHDLHITTADLPRTSIFDLPYGYEVSCNRVGGWCVWRDGQQVAGEYGDGLRLDVAGHVICDSLARPIPPVEMHHCDGCGEDYNAFEESHVGHVIPPGTKS